MNKLAHMALYFAVMIGGMHLLAGGLTNLVGPPVGALFFALLLAWGITEAAGLRFESDVERREGDWGALLVMLGFLGPLVAVVDFTRWGGTVDAPLLTGLGAAAVVAGIALRRWAQVTLGEHFSAHVTVQSGQRIVRDGPFRRVRHPSYAALALIVTGAPLIVGSLIGAAVGAAGIAAFMAHRVPYEERALREAFGAEYDAYAEETPRLVPVRLRR